MKLSVTSAPASEPVTTSEVKSHLRITASDDDTFLGVLLTAAREACELYTRRAFITQTLQLALDRMPTGDAIELPRAPLVSVSSVKWYADDGTATTISTSSYHVDTADPLGGRVVLKQGETWPMDADVRTTNGLIVVYVAGYGAAGAVPEAIKHAIKETVAWMYDRDEFDAGELPPVARHLLRAYRIPGL